MKYREFIHALLQLSVFLIAAIIGYILIGKFPFFSEGPKGEPNFLGFLVVFAVVIIPAVLMCTRLLKLEVVE